MSVVPPVVVVLGATGAGKSKLALDLARRFGGEIISADAMQMYKGLDIVTNKVTKEELEQVPHHVIDFLDPLQHCTVVDFRNRALPIIEKLLSEGKIPFICGGTNYYIESLLWKVLLSRDKQEEHDGERNAPKRPKTDHGSLTSSELHSRLRAVDPDRASELHPNDRRKIENSLDVFARTGKTHSEHLRQQREQDQGSHLGGGLRYGRHAVVWVQCEQEVLDGRCDRRVDKMAERGMIKELEEFHARFNEGREEKDYTRGIFQSIGFKEFHPYLTASPEVKSSPEGAKLLSEGMAQLKLVTRQYSRTQTKWMRNRFLNSHRDCPPVYGVDSTRPEKYDEECLQPAIEVLKAILEGKEPERPPLAKISTPSDHFTSKKKLFHCSVCNRDLPGLEQYEAHLKGKRHLSEVKFNEPRFTVVLKGDLTKTECWKLVKNLQRIPLSEAKARCLSAVAEDGEAGRLDLKQVLVKRKARGVANAFSGVEGLETEIVQVERRRREEEEEPKEEVKDEKSD